MNRKILIFSALLLLASILTSALFSCGEDYVFTHAELNLVLEDGFSELESEEFDLLLSNGEAVVSITRISFIAAMNQGISDTYTAKGFGAFLMHESGKSDEILMHGDLPYYTYTEQGEQRELFYTVTFYRSRYAYFTVAYATETSRRDEWADRFLEFGDSAYFLYPDK